jgi:hypothetical protein
MKRTNKKVSKIEKTLEKRRVVEHVQKGQGLFLFRNRNSTASLELPKPSKDGRKWVEPNGTWEGDSYFLSMVPREAILVRTILEVKKEEANMDERLILDQPDQVTKSGKVEHKVSAELPINEASPEGKIEDGERLITEDPLSGVTIIRD